MSFDSVTKQAVKLFFLLLFVLSGNILHAQEKLSFQDLSFFKSTGANWQLAGDVQADLSQNNSLRIVNGKGVLVNQPTEKVKEHLYTQLAHGDMDIEFDYMMAKGSNSGIYLQSRYEIQLFDSWGVLQPNAADNGGIYERWDEARPEGRKGYEGHAPRQNVSRAPGLWQHLKISFQAPRFEGGKKISNAKMLSVELNGVLVQENVELSGPTRAAVVNDEIPEAPIMIQGDHGPVAFRNMVVRNFNKPKPAISGIETFLYPGKYVVKPDFNKIKPTATQKATVISAAFPGAPNNEFLLRYKGMIRITEPGQYQFNLYAFGGSGALTLNNTEVIPFTSWNSKGSINLSPGEYSFDLCYSKYVDWAKVAMALEMEGPGIRKYTLSDSDIPGFDDADPIEVKVTENTILRSFMDLPVGKRVVHAVSVGSAGNVHYTYDMDNGMIVQLWRGDFLDATPMWHERGDGSSRPAGSVLYFGSPVFMLNKLQDNNTAWMSDTSGADFRVKGYNLDGQDRPVFNYIIYGKKVTDAIKVLEDNTGIQREIKMTPSAENFYARIAAGKSIEEISPGYYLVDDKSYYLKLDDTGGKKPVIRTQGEKKELILLVGNGIRYTIRF